MPGLRRQLLLAWMAIAILTWGIASPVGANDRVPEYEIKAALLFKIARFVAWPPESFDGETDEMVFCVLGDDPFGERISLLQGRKVDGRDIAILRMAKPAEEQRRCHIAFISEKRRDHLRAWLDALADIPVLTVGDTAGFGKDGGTVNLLTRDNRIRFEINVNATSRAGLQVSSQLLQLATIVQSDDTRGGG